MERKEEKKSGCYIVSAALTLVVVVAVKLIWPSVIPFDLFEFWTFKGGFMEVLWVSLPLLVWGAVISIIHAYRDEKNEDIRDNAEEFLLFGFGISVFAGVVEEICFRWIIFYGEILAFKFSNIIFCGIVSWFYMYLVGPIANVLTLGYLKPFLFNGFGWAIGAAIVGSNGKFRDGHAYQGTFGWINSWFGGMYFFYIMFNYGLCAAMLAHFSYDMIVFGIHYIDAAIERHRAS